MFIQVQYVHGVYQPEGKIVNDVAIDSLYDKFHNEQVYLLMKTKRRTSSIDEALL